MNKKTINELEERYELKIPRILDAIKKQKARRVLLQFPDGLKPYASAITDELREKTSGKVEILLWLDSCFGACDIPLEVERLGVDLIIQFGHSAWDYSKRKDIKVLK